MTFATDELRERGVDETVLKFRRLRRRLRLTQNEAAAMAGVCAETLQNSEIGHTRPRAATLAKLRSMIERWEPIARKLNP